LGWRVIHHAAILGCFFLLVLVNCGGGGGGGGSDNGGLVATFTPSCVMGDSCSNGSVTLQTGGTSGSTFQVQVVLNKLNTVIGAAGLIVSYDPTLVEYQAYTKGPALGTGSQTTYLVTEGIGEVDASIIVAGGKTISSAEVMITLTFKAVKAGTTNLIFMKSDTLDGSALYRTDGSIILLGSGGWSGGLEAAS
jgi:Cohesin domain